MWSSISLQKVPESTAIICIEPVLKEKIKELRRVLICGEKRLYEKVYEMAAIEQSIKGFYSAFYEKLGVYEILLRRLKNRFWGIKDDEKKEEKKVFYVDEGMLKKVFRKLAKLYHPDRYKNITDEERAFFEMRMSEANKYFEKKDLNALLSMLEQAMAEVCDDMPSHQRIRILELRISAVKELNEIYQAKIDELKRNDIYILMRMKPDEREKEIARKRRLLLSEIEIYSKLVRAKL
ncbi:MAG: J domain-containing protein [Elusimicrobiales bacterium]